MVLSNRCVLALFLPSSLQFTAASRASAKSTQRRMADPYFACRSAQNSAPATRVRPKKRLEPMTSGSTDSDRSIASLRVGDHKQRVSTPRIHDAVDDTRHVIVDPAAAFRVTFSGASSLVFDQPDRRADPARH